ncbi:restin homolog isoform X2 [Hermetia illucens]|uniref:restin homolog isoform X2 n=2 Tax=Hermetia illucens TaxID=343691 RepID=UPI0018CBFFD5|nr:restin homolog isoform X2 [Hermetia illucens]
MSEGAPKFPSENEASAAANNAANVLVCEESAPPISEQKSPTSSEPKSPASTKSDSKETKPTGIKAPAASKIGRLCQAHQAPKAGPPPLEQKNGDNLSDETMSRLSEEYLRSPLADHGVILTTDTDSFIIGQKVWVGGIRPGQIAYIGETHFAPGDWAGIVLDEPNGKNDGCVSGKRYFQCEPKKGIFSRLTRLTHYPLPNAFTAKESSPNQTGRSIFSPERSRATSPTSSIRSSMRRSPLKQGMTVGDRVIVSSGLGSRAGILKYMGETKFAQGTWCGVQLDEPTGKNDGSVDGVRYFECPSKYGVFVPIAKVSLSPSSRKSRLSRAGSRESLTSVGTLNSIATTNTSRLRMGMGSQKIPTATKIASAPKNTYSLQDVIREKQNHIEQLMIERDLDREDSQNQAMLFQKNISELQSRVAELEKLLEDERKKTEELQFSIDEAQFCGDELNAQTQVYKERISELEKQLQKSGTEPSSASEAIPPRDEQHFETLKKENEKLTTEIETLQSKLNESTKDYEFKAKDLVEREQQLQEELEFIKQENEEMRKELLAKDESSEKLYLTIQELQNTLLEETAAKNKSTEDKKVNDELLKTCNEKDELIKQLTSDVEILKEQVDVAAKKNDETRSSLKNLEDENTTLKNKLDEATSEIAALKDNQEKSTSGNEEYIKSLTLLKDENENFKKVHVELSEKSQQLQAALDNKVQELLELNKRLDEIQKNKDDLFLENEATKNQLHAISNEKTILESEMVQREQEVETSKIIIEELGKDKKLVEENLKEATKTINSLNEEKGTLIAKLEVMQEKMKGSESQQQNDSKELQKLKSELVTLVADMGAKTVTIEEQASKLKKMESFINEKQSQNNKLENTIKELTDQCENIKVAKAACETRIAELEIESADKTRSVESITQKCDEFSKQNQTLQQELTNLRNASSDTNSEVARLTTNLVEKQKSYEELLDTSNTVKNKLERELQESAQYISTLNKEIDALKQTAETKAKVNAELQAQIETLKASDQSKETEIDNLRKAIESEKENLNKVIATNSNEAESLRSQLDTQISSLQNEVSALETELANTKSHSKSTEESLLKQMSEYGNEKEKLLNELKQLKDSEISLQNLLEKQKENENSSIQSYGLELQKKEEEIKSLNETITSIREECGSLITKIKEIETSQEDAHKTNELLKCQISSESEKSKELMDEVEKLKAAIQEKDSESQNLKQLNSDLLSQISAKETDKASVLGNLQALQTEKEETINALKIEISKKSEAQTTLQAELQRAQESAKDLKQNLEELSVCNETAKKQLLEKEETIKTQTDNILHLNQLVEKLQIEIISNKQQMAQMMSTYTDQIEMLNQTLSQKCEENSKLLKNSAELKADSGSHAEKLSANLLKEIESQKILSEKYQVLSKEHNTCKTTIVGLEQLVADSNKKISDLTIKVKDLEKVVENGAKKDSATKGEYEELQRKFNKLQQDKCTTEKLLENEINKSKSDTKQSPVEASKIDNSDQNNSVEQINFLNSIIADMQKKNEALKARIDTLEAIPLDFTKSEAFNIVGKRKPAPRLFCDICDIFDAHDTEDCPQQSSDSPPGSAPQASSAPTNPNNDARVLPPPRMFCDICEIFDAHETEDCSLQCF